MQLFNYDIGEIVVTFALAGATYYVSRYFAQDALNALKARIAELEKSNADHRRAAADLYDRSMRAEKTVESLQKSIIELPDIAQRLSACRDLRDIPARSLELVQELFEPGYATFYVTRRGELVAAAGIGECEFPVGHRVKFGEGIVGWTGLKQLPMTPEDVRFESAHVKHRSLSTGMPQSGFSLCLPVVYDSWTLGVILVGPMDREVPREREVGRTIAMLTSVTMMSALTLKQQRNLAKTDGLTGLLNKTHLVRRIEEAMEAGAGSPRVISAFLFDIDHFKHYNDTNGHIPGDDLLRQISALLGEAVREREFIGRYGGEEFLLVLPGVDKKKALHAAERIRKLIEKEDFKFGETQPGGRLTISGGVATWPMDAENAETLIRHADEALYEAKRGGRNRVLPYAPPDLSGQRVEMDPPGEVEELLTEVED